MNRHGREILMVVLAVAVGAIVGFVGARFTVASDSEIEAAAHEFVPESWTVEDVLAFRPYVEFWLFESRPGFEATVTAQRPGGTIEASLETVRSVAEAAGWVATDSDERPGAFVIDFERGSLRAEVGVFKVNETARFRVMNNADTVRARRWIGALIGATLAGLAAAALLRRRGLRRACGSRPRTNP